MTVPARAMPSPAVRGAGAPHFFVLAALQVLLVLGGVSFPSTARADGRGASLAAPWQPPPTSGQADDFRVRTNAALALGAPDDASAVAPLCAGLDDPKDL